MAMDSEAFLEEQTNNRNPWHWHLRDLPHMAFVALVVTIIILLSGVMLAVAFACVSDRLAFGANTMSHHDFLIWRRQRHLAANEAAVLNDTLLTDPPFFDYE